MGWIPCILLYILKVKGLAHRMLRSVQAFNFCQFLKYSMLRFEQWILLLVHGNTYNYYISGCNARDEQVCTADTETSFGKVGT